MAAAIARGARARAAGASGSARRGRPPTARASSALDDLAAGTNQRSRRAARLAPIEAAVDENAREPDLERPRFAIGRDVREHLDEGVLDGLVGFGGVAKILIGDARRPGADGWRRARRTARAPRPSSPRSTSAADLDREPRVVRQRRRRRARPRRGSPATPGCRTASARRRRDAVRRSPLIEALRCESAGCLQFTAPVRIVDSTDRASTIADSAYIAGALHILGVVDEHRG